MQIRTCLNNLKSTNEITIKTTNRFSIITICNYSTYQFEKNGNNQQNNQPLNQQITNKQPTDNQQITTNNNVNNAKNVNNDKNKEQFECVRKLYPGNKRGLDTEYTNFCKKHSDWKEVLLLLLPAVEAQIAWRKEQASADSKAFIPQWANFQTWINQRRWEQELPAIKAGSTGISAGTTQKTKLWPITGKNCSKSGCRMPAVYKDSSGQYDSYYCSNHLPETVKEKYV